MRQSNEFMETGRYLRDYTTTCLFPKINKFSNLEFIYRTYNFNLVRIINYNIDRILSSYHFQSIKNVFFRFGLLRYNFVLFRKMIPRENLLCFLLFVTIREKNTFFFISITHVRLAQTDENN